jgi:hypothetical protein
MFMDYGQLDAQHGREEREVMASFCFWAGIFRAARSSGMTIMAALALTSLPQL